MLNAHPAEGETPSFKGSMMIVVADSAEQAFELLKKDIYVVSGVWDMDNAQIIPVCCSARSVGYPLLTSFSTSLLFARLCRALLYIRCLAWHWTCYCIV